MTTKNNSNDNSRSSAARRMTIFISCLLGEVVFQGLDEGGDGGFVGFDLRIVAEVAEGGGGDGADLKADALDGACGGGADDGDTARDGGEVVVPGAVLGSAVEGFDGVGAGEDEPVVGADGGEGGVERGEGFGWGELDGGDED